MFLRYARKNGYPHLEHVTLPRVGALQTLLKSLSLKSVKQNGDEDSIFNPGKGYEQ